MCPYYIKRKYGTVFTLYIRVRWLTNKHLTFNCVLVTYRPQLFFFFFFGCTRFRQYLFKGRVLACPIQSETQERKREK